MSEIVVLKQGMGPDYRKTVRVLLNPKDNGGESILLEVDCFHNGEREYVNVSFTSSCYGVHSSTQTFYNLSLEQIINALKIASVKV